MIEIVMDDDDNAPVVAAPNDGMVPVIAPPAPPSRGHRRGRSSGDASLSGRLSKATERLGSASRGRKESGRSVIRSPPIETCHHSKPKSAVQLRFPIDEMPPPVRFDADLMRSPIEPKGKHISTGLHRSEMI
ncbi:hypothetical protein OCS_06904 [Ophiocordyceps sinensis CO18]|nr:hypothetical protein OCS_06904 [Ophiocordyceps sinensis CO18]